MNSFSKSDIKEQLKLIASVALIVWFANSVFGEAEQTFLTSGSYTATTGGSISGSATIAADASASCGEFDDTWTDYVDDDGEDQWCISLAGTGTHPITSSDVNYFGTCCYTLTYPEPANSGNETQGFTISCTNTALNYDKTGTISVSSDCSTLTEGSASASVTIYNTASQMQIAFLLGTNLYNSCELIRGEGVQTGAVEILRQFGDTLNTRTVNFTVSGTATNGVDYTGITYGNNTATINAGTNIVRIPFTLVQNSNVVGTRIFTVTLTSGFYQITTNNTATMGIIQDVPTFDITAPGPWSSPNGDNVGEFTITRTGGMSNSVTAHLAIGGTAVSGTDYTALPTSIKFGTNQASTNLFVNAINANLSTLKSVLVSIVTNSTYELGLTTDAVVTLTPNSMTTNSVTSPVGRYWRGSGTDPTYWSMVVPLDSETGTVYSNINGNCSNLYSGLPSWSSTTYYHYNASNSLPQNVPANLIPFNNPIVAFGERVGGTPLYYGQSYQFGIYAGDPVPTGQPVIIQVYYRTNYQLAGTIDLYPPSSSNTSGWTYYTTNGFQISTNAFGLTTILSSSPSLNYGADSWGSVILTHTASLQATNYYYVVSLAGYPADGSYPMAIDSGDNIQPSLLYSLEFEAHPAWRSTFLDQPQFAGKPLPPYYDGMSLSEMMTNSPPVTNTVSFTPSGATNLDDSPELRRSPILDSFVASMNNDPIALANYVINQVDLVDQLDYTDDGNVSEQSVNLGGATRGALGTFLEKQGSPWDQCALLVYLLRQAGVPAVYEFAPRNGLMMLDSRLTQMLKFQVQGALNPAGVPYTTNSMIPVNYPWVAAYIGTNWVHIFPWIKDTELTQGLNLWEEMPTNYTDGYQWVRDYIYGNSNLLSLAQDGDNTPRVIFPAYLQQTLLQNHPGVSVDDIGTQIINRQHYYASWGAFPTPTWVTNVSTSIESLSSSAITNIDPNLTNIFDTVSVEIQSVTDPTKDIQTGDMPLVELENREFYIYQYTTNGNVNLNLILMPFRTNITTVAAFTNDATLLDKEVLSMKFDQFDSQLNVNFRYKRHKALTAAYPIYPPAAFFGLNAVNLGAPPEEIDFTRPLYVGDQAAIVMDYGQVSTEMLNVDAQSLWQMEANLRAHPTQTNSVSSDVYEGALMNLAGMSYFEKCDEFDQFNRQIQGADKLSSFSAGLSKIIPGRDQYGDLTNGTDPILPCVDMYYYESAIAANGTTTPTTEQEYTMFQQNYFWLLLADGSAEEHQVINRFYQQTNAVSTVRLLQLAQSRGQGIVAMTPFNYASQGATSYQGQQLQNWDPSLWQSVAGALGNAGLDDYASAYMTPGPITNAVYRGMAAMIFTPNAFYALITPYTINGGIGQYLQPGSVSQPGSAGYNVTADNDNYQATLNAPTSGNATAQPSETASFNASQEGSYISGGEYDPNSFQQTADSAEANSQGLANGNTAANDASDTVTASQTGNLGTANDGGTQTGVQVSDPVNNITGEFYVQETDLELPGPIPLALHRNYSSQNLADNQFGYGWKLSIMPYLVISTKATNIYAADMDGAVLDYVHSTNSAGTNLWSPTLKANPQLDNNTTAGVGSLANRLRDYILRSVSGSITNYTLYGADGSVRVFQFIKFESGTITNDRPYLTTWTDNCGNYYTFSYDTNPADADYSQMTRVKCSNGNYFNFDYDIYGHMVDAYTGDGRWIYYTYDEYGDLTTVTLPDGSVRSYQYQLGTQSVTNSGHVTQSSYSTHLITEEDKPDGRELLNVYDSQRRVTNQWSTAGSDLNPILTATFIYSNNFALTNSFTNLVHGYTYVIDGNGNTNRYDYTNSLITQITDPLGYTIQQTWYPDNATSPGYPRSVQERKDMRGLLTTYLYDSNGNVTNVVFTGDLTGDGIVTQTATNTAVYNTNSLAVQTTDPSGNSIATVYDPVFNFKPSQIIYYSAGTAISTNLLLYGNATNVVTDGNIQQTNLAFGLNTRTVRAYGSTDAATNDTFYNGQGFPTEIIQYTGTGDPNITNYYFYNERDLVVDSTDSLGAVTFYDYDPMDRPTEKQTIDEFGNTLSLVTTYYNENGETNWTDGPQYNPDNYTYFDYDGMGRLSTKIHWRSEANSSGTGLEQPSGYNLYAQSFYEYDPLGNLLLAVSPRGAMVTNSYDALCRLVQSTCLDTDGQTALSSDSFSYEAGGEVQSHTNALGGVTTMYYNIMGQPEYRINVDGSTNGWRYYLDGRTYRQIQSNGAYLQSTYDDVNRITTQVFYSAAGVPEATNSMQFDRRGNVIQTIDPGFNIFNAAYDDLNRIKTANGPATINITETGMSPGDLTYVTNVTQHALAYFYDSAGRFIVTSNALGQIAVSQFDAIGRPLSSKSYNSTGALVRESYTAYSSDNNSVSVTNGSGANAVFKTSWIDTDGHTVLSIAYPSSGKTEFAENEYDLAGNLVLSEHNSSSGGSVTTWTSSSSTYDGLNRVTSTTDRDGAVTYFAYDPLNDLTNRTVPGNLVWLASYNSAGQMSQEQVVGGGNATRTTAYYYYSLGSPFAGSLEMKIDARGTTCNYSYDDWLRTTNMTCTGLLPEQNLTTAWQYDPRGNLIGMTEQFGTTNTGPATSIHRSYDAYGELSSESVSDGSFVYGASQSWDVTGHRSMLGIGNNGYSFGYQGDGSMISAGGAGGGGAYSYSTAGILTNRTVGIRNTGITSFDGEGRPLTINTTVDGQNLIESLSYSSDGLIESDTLNRPDYTDSRSYNYANLSRRLTYEQLNLNNSTTYTNNFTYDNGTAAGPGALTSLGSSSLWDGGVDAFSRINSETNNTFSYPAYGHVNGQASLTAWLDSNPVSIVGIGTNAMQWQANMELSPGSHQLTVAALHPSGRFTAWATNYFTNSLAFQQTVDSYDANGDITNRVWENPSGTVERTQALSWDARGRLHAVTQRDAGNSGYNWTAVYDPFNRRLSTTTVLVTNGVVCPSSVQTINSYYDPQFEFMELGVSYGTKTEWKLYGPDLSGQYGGMNGVGGLDGTSPGLSLFNPTITDIRGDVLGFYDSAAGSNNWNSARPTGYGAVPNYRPVALASGGTLEQSSAWRGRWVDITGYYNIGLRPYDPVSGRWLTYDSAWNRRDPNYYSFAGGDPINDFDADGRTSQNMYQDPAAALAYIDNNDPNANTHGEDDISYLFNNNLAFRAEAQDLFGGAFVNDYGQVVPNAQLDGDLPFSDRLALIYAVAGGTPTTDYSFSDAQASAAYYNNVAANGLSQGGITGYAEFFASETGEDVMDFFGASGVQQSAMRSGAASGSGQRGKALAYGALTTAAILANAIPGGGKVGTLAEETGSKAITKLLDEGASDTLSQTYKLGAGASRSTILDLNRDLYDQFVDSGGQIVLNRDRIEFNEAGNQVLGTYNAVNNTISLYYGSNLSTVSEELIHFSQIQRAGLLGQGIPTSMVPGLEQDAATVLQQWGYVPK